MLKDAKSMCMGCNYATTIHWDAIMQEEIGQVCSYGKTAWWASFMTRVIHNRPYINDVKDLNHIHSISHFTLGQTK